jgi:hypothetical protein
MERVRVTSPLMLPSGTVLYLSVAQSGLRRHSVEPLAQLGWFRAIKALSFKAGEVLGFESLAKRIVKQVEILDKKEPPFSAQQADNAALLTMPEDLNFLEQVAWQLVATEGPLTITTYHKRCRSVGRRRLQKVIKGLVEKSILVREGQSHHRCYRFGERACK